MRVGFFNENKRCGRRYEKKKRKGGEGNSEEEIMWEEDSVGADQDWVELADCPTQLIS